MRISDWSSDVCSSDLGDKEAKVALDDTALVFSEAVRVFPERDVARHIDFLRHPVIGASGQILFPSPFVFERHQLVAVGLAVDDAFVGGAPAARAVARASCRIWCWSHGIVQAILLLIRFRVHFTSCWCCVWRLSEKGR